MKKKTEPGNYKIIPGTVSVFCSANTFSLLVLLKIS